MPEPTKQIKRIKSQARALTRALVKLSGVGDARLRRLRHYVLEVSSSCMAQVYGGLLRPEELALIHSALLAITVETFWPDSKSESLFLGDDPEEARLLITASRT